ncbi:MAG: DUF2071 domain-containing protein [Bacteroidia bacterium]|nr:DUF2071 domain-containing protein [Bacteroidia bacterium]
MAIFLKAKWENIIMVNYAVDAALLQPYLPKGVELDMRNGKAVVSMVGFIFKNSKLFNIPIPYLGTFEEVNLRFYVIRKDGNEVKRGVVFINETVPYKIVAWLANKLYNESYSCVRTRHTHTSNAVNKQLTYQWQVNNKWNTIHVEATNESATITANSDEEFIYEHYYGYAKVSDTVTEEYKINHPSWNVNKVVNYNIECDFKAMYGPEFEFLTNTIPNSVFIAEGSAISVNWKRNKIM